MIKHRRLDFIPGEDSLLNPLILSFRDQETEELFDRRYFQINLQTGRFSHVLAVFFYLLVAAWDVVFIEPSRLAVWIPVCLVVTAMFTGGYVMTWKVREFYSRHWQKLFALYVTVTGLGFTAVTVLSNPVYPRYNFIGIIFCLIFCYTIIRLTFLYAAIAGNLIVLVYFAATALFVSPDTNLLLTGLFYTSGINLLGMIVCYSLELMARRDFMLNRLLERAEKDAHRTNEKLEAMVDERTRALRETRDQLVQAQKMESIGRLAGGVAHDYNNISGIIIGYTEMALEEMDCSDPLKKDLQEVHRAALRATEITAQLLAFARKQTVSPRVIDLNAAVEKMKKMLERLIGENIRLVWKPCRDIRPLKIDPSQIDQILANLAVNSRDAITGNGTVTISTENVRVGDSGYGKNPEAEPGDYLMLCVEDDGQGMKPDVQDKVFEPFFTTKARGKGTGLGLSTVYGIVKQNGGFARIESVFGEGTRICIYLPSCTGELSGETEQEDHIPELGKGETILIIEDDPAILQLAGIMLESSGYAVHTASTAKEAVEKTAVLGEQLDLVITDVVMPDMNGRELAARIGEMVQGVPVVFMSGYTADVIAEHGILDQGMEFIQKPFTRMELTSKVRSVVHRRSIN